MTKFEAVLHYGMTRRQRPTAGALRDMFFACVVAGENMDGDVAKLATVLMRAYIAAREIEDEECDLELLEAQEAEQVFRTAYEAAYREETGEAEVPDGLARFEFVEYKSVGLAYPRALMADAGHLLAYYDCAQEDACAKYIESAEGQQRLASKE